MKDRAYAIAPNPIYNEYQRGLASIVYKNFHKKTGSGANVNEVLAQELHIPVIKKFKLRKVFVRFKDNIWVADLAEMRPFSSKNGGVKYFLCVMCFHKICLGFTFNG